MDVNVLIVGDGPAGLSAALFLAKAGCGVTVFGDEESSLEHAHLYNYLGIPSMAGTEFRTIALEQVARFGASLTGTRAATAEATAEGFRVEDTDGNTADGQYLVLAEGRKPEIAEALGVAAGSGGLTVDSAGRTSVDGVYAAGRATRLGRSQAIISAGDGARTALDILERETGKPFQDWDTPD